MTRTRQTLTGLGALLLLTGLVVVVPWALVRYIGWPLPHAIPTWPALKAGLTTRGIPPGTLIKALALVVWAGWAVLAATVAAEVADALGGRPSRQVPLAGAVHPLVQLLVAAVVVALLGALPKPTVAGHLPLAVSLAATGQHTPTTPAFLTENAQLRSPAQRVDAAREAPADGLRPYVVQRRDTLWGIADTQLGDPTRWKEIFALNEGRHQPGGQALTDANRIWPGWTLLLPTPPSAAAAPNHQHARQALTAASATPPHSSPPVRAATPPLAAPTPAAQPHAPDSLIRPTAETSTTAAPTPAGRHAASITLTSGSEVGAAFAAAVLAALAAARLRRRRRYQPTPPAPARYRTSPPLPAPLRDLLRRPEQDHDEEPETTPPNTSAPDGAAYAMPACDPTAPHDIEIGTRDGQPVHLPLTGWGGLALTGTGAEATARAWLAALIAQAGPLGVQIYATRDLISDLLPGMHASPAIHLAPDEAALLPQLEQQVLARGRKLAAAAVSDAASYRRKNPEDPFPAVLAVMTAPPRDDRWSAVLRAGRPLDIDALILGTTEPADAGAVIEVNDSGDVQNGTAGTSARVAGARLFRLNPQDALPLLRPIAADHASATATDPPDPTSHRPAHLDTAEAEGAAIGWTTPTPRPLLAQPGPAAAVHASAAAETQLATEEPSGPALRVQLLGPLRIWAHGNEITTGLRTGARELLAWYLLRPTGASAAEAIEAIWPDVPPERGPQRFWNALGNLRSRLRAADGTAGLEILVKTAGRYRPETDQFDVDVWQFQAALATAARSPDSTTAREALEAATATFHGDLLHGDDHLWVEPLREELHRRAIDAHLRLAELQADAGNPDAALETLERAITIDTLAEEAYRRILTIQASLDRVDAVRRTWELLRGRLAEIELDPEAETVAQYRKVMGAATR